MRKPRVFIEANTVAENIKEVLGEKYFKPKKNFNYCTMLKVNKVQQGKQSIYDPTIKGPEVAL